MAMGLLCILTEALKIPVRNGKLMFSIALLFLIPSSLIFIGNYFALQPVTNDLVLKAFGLIKNGPISSEFSKLLAGVQVDFQILVGETTIFMFARYALTFFLTVAMIYASAASYFDKHLNFKELILRIGRTWKRSLITWCYVTLFSIGYSTLLAPLIFVLMVTTTGSVAFTVFGALIALLLLFLSFYVSLIWRLGLVVSVIEDGYCGMKALGKAEELIKGRKLQGYVLSLLISLVQLAISVIFGFKMSDIKLTSATRFAIGLAYINVSCLEQLFIWSVFTVFYLECKESNGEEEEMQVGTGYGLVSTATLVDASLP